jgi:hypothetical protein
MEAFGTGGNNRRRINPIFLKQGKGIRDKPLLCERLISKMDVGLHPISTLLHEHHDLMERVIQVMAGELIASRSY